MSIFLSGTNEGLSRTTSLHDFNAAHTTALWFYKTTSADDILYSNHEGSGNTDQMRVDASELWEARANIGGTGPDVNDGFNISLNTWYFAALVRTSVTDLTAHLFSLAGAEVSSPTATQDVTGRTAQTTTSVGHRSLNNDWTGRVHNIKIWTAALTVAELTRELRRTRPVRFANLAAWYPTFNGSSAVHERDVFAGLNWTEDGTPDDADPPPISWGMPQSQIGVPAAAAVISIPVVYHHRQRI